MAVSQITKIKGTNDVGRLAGTTADLDNLNKRNLSGLYYLGANAANAPASYCGLVNICYEDGGFTAQICFTGNYIYARTYSGSPIAWGAWKRATLATV